MLDFIDEQPREHGHGGGRVTLDPRARDPNNLISFPQLGLNPTVELRF